MEIFFKIIASLLAVISAVIYFTSIEMLGEKKCEKFKRILEIISVVSFVGSILFFIIIGSI